MKAKTTVFPTARLAALCAVLLLGLFFAIPASAAEVSIPAEIGTETTAVTAAPVGMPSGEDETDGEEYNTFSGYLSDFLAENAAEIISGATLTLGLVLTFLLRKKLLPSILEALGSLLGKSREAVDAIAAGHEAEHAELGRILNSAEELLGNAKEAAARAEEAVEAIRGAEAERECLRTVLAEQSALLYELLMTASLPQYQKDKIGSAHAATERALAEARHE